MSKDPLHFFPVNKWGEIQEAFKADWPRGIMGITVLEHQRQWIGQGLDYGFKVYVPYGDVLNGIVCINEKSTSYEVVIQCPRDDTEKLAEALRTTKVVDWKKPITLPFAPKHILECIQGLFSELHLEINRTIPSECFYLDKKSQPFEDVTLPPEATFGYLTNDHVDVVDTNWPHRYPGSTWYFELLIKTRCGFGLFMKGELISWLLINEFGILTHVFTLENHRKKGYSEKLLKIVCNIMLKEKKDVYVFCVKTNVSACNLYNKLGFTNYNKYEIAWHWLKPNDEMIGK